MAIIDTIQKYNPFEGVGAGIAGHFQNLGNIKADAPSQRAYNIEATRDLWSNLSENITSPVTRGIMDYAAPALSLVTSPIYDSMQAGIRTVYDTNTGEFRGPLDNFDITNTMNPDYKGNPTPGFFTRLDQENPISSAWERYLGAGQHLSDKYFDDETDTIDVSNPQVNLSGLGIMSGLNKLFGPKIAAYLKNKALQQGIGLGAQKLRHLRQAQMQEKIRKAEAAAAANARAQRRAGKGGSHMSRGRDQGGLGITSQQAQQVSDANKAAGMSGWGL